MRIPSEDTISMMILSDLMHYLFHPCVRIFYYSKENLYIVQPTSVSCMFSLQLTHITPPFRLLQIFHWYKVYVLRMSYVENVEVVIYP